MKIAHIADTHLGYRKAGATVRFDDVLSAFGQAVEQIIAEKVDIVIHAGDLFDHPKPSFQSLACAIEGYKKLCYHVRVITVAGNHDMSRLPQHTTSFNVLEKATDFKGEFYEASYRILSYKPWLAIDCIPWGTEPYAKPAGDRPTIAVMHGFPRGIKLASGEEAEATIPEEWLHKDYAYIALGHYHIGKQVRDNTWFAGSTERFGFGDLLARPGWNLVTIDDETGRVTVERKLLDVRRMSEIVVNPGTRGVDYIISSVIDHIGTNKDVNYRVRTVNATLRDVQIAKRELATELAWRELPLTWKPEKKGGARATKDFTLERPERFDIFDMLHQFVAEERVKRPEESGMLIKFLDRGLIELQKAKEAEDE
jgi:hypothetical protein